jgi:hypothetical protein
MPILWSAIFRPRRLTFEMMDDKTSDMLKQEWRFTVKPADNSLNVYFVIF